MKVIFNVTILGHSIGLTSSYIEALDWLQASHSHPRDKKILTMKVHSRIS